MEFITYMIGRTGKSSGISFKTRENTIVADSESTATDSEN